MNFDFTPFFKKYEDLVKTSEALFHQVKEQFPHCVKCKEGCSDCCYALFDLSFIEAMYINQKFTAAFESKPQEKAEILEKANVADRSVYKLKKKAYKALEAGESEEKILGDLAKERIRCPLLNNNDMCDLYEFRPITCRFYGIPTAIGGKGHSCGLSGFKKGTQYPTVNLDIVHKHLYQISDELVRAMKSKYIKMSELLVPLSMALLTDYNEEYLGIIKKEPGPDKKGGRDG